MKHIYLNLKRFDIPRKWGGVNGLAAIDEWAATIIGKTEAVLRQYGRERAEFVMYLPEAHLLPAMAARTADSPIVIGAQGIHWEDTAVGGNFGAFTTARTANAVAALGGEAVLIGHCEERRAKAGILKEAGVVDQQAINRLLNKEVHAALEAGLKVLYCVGESSEEMESWQQVIGDQLATGLSGVDHSKVVIAYEPIWSIGPGKTPAGPEHIAMIARFIKERLGPVAVVYGGGLKKENAGLIAGIPEIDGGLIALTRFSGEIGFYPEEYLEIIKIYIQNI
jgi:triosephosphate isomerase